MSAKHNRREFGKTVALGAAALAAGALDQTNAAEKTEPLASQTVDAVARPSIVAPAGGVPDSRKWHVRTFGNITGDGQVFQESARNIPVAQQCDVLVCGGGPAGVAAALAAARSGAKTTLLEVNGCLGGVWTAGLLSWIIDAGNKPGIMLEIYAELIRRKAGTDLDPKAKNFPYDPEAMKLLLEDLLIEAKVSIRLHTRVVGAVNDRNNRLQTVVTESKSGREAWTAKCFVDCTGDGDLAAQAGCEFEIGHPETGGTQPMTLMGILTGLTLKEVAPFVNNYGTPRGYPAKKLLFSEFKKGGVEPSYGLPTLFRIHDDLYALMANHQYGVLAVDARDVTNATLTARREVHKLVGTLKGLGGKWKNVRLVTTGEQIGTRGGRRIRGRYYMKGEDLRDGKRFEDGICPVTFGIDVHSIDPKKTKGIEKSPFKAKPYDIPLRALIARDVSGLLMAGRCISGDFIAHSSYRVTGNSVAMGEAAGVAAAVAAQNKALPHDVPFENVSTVLDKIRDQAMARSK